MIFDKKTILVFLLLSFVVGLTAQNQEMKYRRSSLYSILIRHPDKRFDRDIDTVFAFIPIPEKYNDHNLKIRSINSASKRTDKTEEENIKETIEAFILKNDLAKRIVSKWFNRKQGKSGDGTFDMNLVIQRGLYDADYYDAQQAAHSIRGQSLLADAGEELIGNTFVLFNDIRYMDRDDAAYWENLGIVFVGAIASELTGGLAGLAIAGAENVFVRVNNEIAGFRVIITSYLYQLNWNEEIANTFYSMYYMSEPDTEKKMAFNKEKGLFKLNYIGSHTIATREMSLRGVQSKNDMIRKVCERAIDKNIAQLQKEYEVFRVKTPLFSTEPLTAKIGLKEDIDEKSKFEVLEMIEDADGRMNYKRVGVVRPIKGKIWDNRFMAEFEEENEGSTLTATEFEVISGSGFYPGMLLRQID